MAEDAMTGGGRGVVALSDDQFAAAKCCERDLDGALGKTGRVGKRSYTRSDRFPSLPHGLAVKIQINQIGRRLSIVPDQIAHEDIENVVVDGNDLFEARHGESEK
jgi:uncharacterized protein YwbE